jgi:hypothetical protein
MGDNITGTINCNYRIAATLYALEQCFPNFFVHGPLLASSNNDGSLLTEIVAGMIGIQN